MHAYIQVSYGLEECADNAKVGFSAEFRFATQIPFIAKLTAYFAKITAYFAKLTAYFAKITAYFAKIYVP
jgi:hypothetical protein